MEVPDMMESLYMMETFMGIILIGLFCIGLIGLFCLASAFVMPWVNCSRINRLREKTGQLATSIKELTDRLENKGTYIPEKLKPKQLSPFVQTHHYSDPAMVKQDKIEEDSVKESEIEKTVQESTRSVPEPKASGSFVQPFGASLSVWGSGIVLICAGFLLLKFPMELLIGISSWLCCLVMPWVNRSRIKRLCEEAGRLTTIIKELTVTFEQKGSSIPEELPPSLAPAQTHHWSDPAMVKQDKIEEDEVKEPEIEETVPKENRTAPDSTSSNSFEQQFGARLPVWGGVIALMLAAFFVLKFSIITIVGISLGLFCLVNSSLISRLREEIGRLSTIIKELMIFLEKEGSYLPEKLKSEQPLLPAQTHYAPAPAVVSQDKIAEDEATEFKFEKEETDPKKTGTAPKSKPSTGFEQQFGVRLPVWVGGIALTLAGVFLVKYSIDIKLLTPAVRVILGGLLGGILLYGAEWVRKKPHFANGIRIAQSLSGAGIAVLYASLFAATSLYQLIPYFLGFLGMGIVTATAVALSLRHGPPIALLGLIGGFWTPVLVGTSAPHILTLFIYLYLLFIGLMIVIKRKNWWILSIPTLLGVFFWVVLWTTSLFTPSDTIWLGLFLIAVSATIVISSKRSYEEDTAGASGVFSLTSILNYVGLSGAMILMGVIAGKAGFDVFEWSLFGLLAAGGIGLAYFNDRLYGFVPWVSMAVTTGMLIAWETPDAQVFALTLTVFALAFAGTGYFLMWYTNWPLLWAGLAGAASIVFYLLAYFKLRNTGLVDAIPSFWTVTAIALAGIAVCAVQKIREHYHDHPHKDHLLALFAANAAAFMSIGLTIELQRDFLPVAFAAEMFAIAWINSRIPIKALRPISMVLALAFGFLLIPQIQLVMISSMGGTKLSLVEGISIPIVQWPAFQLGIPATMFIGTSFFLRREKDDNWVRILELTAVGLVAVMGYYLTRHAFYVELDDILFAKAGFFQRSVVTNILFIQGLACLYIGKRFDRGAFSMGGTGLCTIAIFRIVYFDLLIYNPLWTQQKIEGWLVVNSLLLPYGLPMLWAWLAGNKLPFTSREQWAKCSHGFMLLLLFVLINLNVRYFFHGEYLDSGITTNAEIYTYSVAWLILAVTLLLAGVITRAKMLRYASLGIMILTVGKVFLYDASELEGLYRVFSFLGLGLSLLGLSWLYTRFIFRDKVPPPSK